MDISKIPKKPGVYTVGNKPIVVWKWAKFRAASSYSPNHIYTKVLVKLLLLPKTKVVVPLRMHRPNGRKYPARKFRVDQAYVLAITSMEGKPVASGTVFSHHNPSFTYRERTLIAPRSQLDESIKRDCASGIHAFRTAKVAKEGETQ